jgi:pilus assembly protein CpaB
MKPARIIVLAIALIAGGLAFMLSGGEPPKPTQIVVQSQDVVEILVAKSEIPVGRAVAPEDLNWTNWPSKASGPLYITKAQRPNAIEDLKGAVARAPFVPGEPIREEKLIKADGSGFMSAILPAGMRAVSTEISAETGAGGFILPNDRVDVILTRREGDNFLSETVLRNVRVLAIDQTVEEKNGQKVVVGKTATLELSARQAETLALSRQRGTLSLALRSLADAMPVNAGKKKPEEEEQDRASGSINVVRFGVTSTQTAR